MKNRKIELLAPAGSLDRLKWAFDYGADAVYIGGRNFSLRANATNFSLDEIKEACEYAHKLGKKVYVTVNIIFHNEDYLELENYLRVLASYKVDAIIVADIFILDLVKKLNIELPVHISTQSSSMNKLSCRYLKSLGAERVVLGRELSKQEIKEIIDDTGIEVECFIHGAMCAAYSGRCVLSNYFTNRDANRGGCSQICRFEFDLLDPSKNKVNSNIKFTMSCKDLSMITYIKEMIDINVSSLKIEGRMRSNYYIASVVDAYRHIIDSYYDNTLTDEKIKYYQKVLDKVSNRESIAQFFDGPVNYNHQYYLGRDEKSNQEFLGIVFNYDEETKEVSLSERNFFKPGDEVEIFGPNKEAVSFVMPEIFDEFGNPLDAARHPEEIIKFKIDLPIKVNDLMRKKI